MESDEQDQVTKKLENLSVILNQETPIQKYKKESVQNSALILLKGRKMIYNTFESGIFQLAPFDHSNRSAPPEYHERIFERISRAHFNRSFNIKKINSRKWN